MLPLLFQMVDQMDTFSFNCDAGYMMWVEELTPVFWLVMDL